MSSISGASGPRAGERRRIGSGWARVVRNIADAAAAHTTAAISPIAMKRRRGDRAVERLGIGEERRVRDTRPGEPTMRRPGTEALTFARTARLRVTSRTSTPNRQQPRRDDRRRLQERRGRNPS